MLYTLYVHNCTIRYSLACQKHDYMYMQMTLTQYIIKTLCCTIKQCYIQRNRSSLHGLNLQLQFLPTCHMNFWHTEISVLGQEEESFYFCPKQNKSTINPSLFHETHKCPNFLFGGGGKCILPPMPMTFGILSCPR